MFGVLDGPSYLHVALSGRAWLRLSMHRKTVGIDEVRHQSHCRWCAAAAVGGGGLVVVVVAETLCTWHARRML